LRARWRRGIPYALGLTLIVLAPACRLYKQDVWTSDATSPPADAVYQLREGDVLEYTLPQDKTLDGKTRVRSDGIASFPLVGELKVGGLSLSQSHALLLDGLAEFLESPEIHITLATTRDREIYIAGEVKNPGNISYQDDLTVLDAMLRAGGPLKASADIGNVILVRTEEGGERLAWRMDFSDIWTTASPPHAVNLLPGDIILVPNTAVDRANIAVEKYITRMIPGGAVLQRFLVGATGD
jgi:polysaccharide export outer membrane protein